MALSKLFSKNEEGYHNNSLLNCLEKNIHETSKIRVYLELAEHVCGPAIWQKYNQAALLTILKS